MKRYILGLLMLAATIAANAQVKLEDIVKPGTKLVYAVEANGSSYDFIVTIKDKNGSSFEWKMTAPASISGKIIHTPAALRSGYNMWNMFNNGEKTLSDNTLSVWLSQDVLKAFSEKGKDVEVGMYGANAPALKMRSTGESDLEITVDGKTVKIQEKMVKPFTMDRGFAKPDESKDAWFTYNNSADFPVILRMSVGFNLHLKAVITKP
jgi:hypothetical protein